MPVGHTELDPIISVSCNFRKQACCVYKPIIWFHVAVILECRSGSWRSDVGRIRLYNLIFISQPLMASETLEITPLTYTDIKWPGQVAFPVAAS